MVIARGAASKQSFLLALLLLTSTAFAQLPGKIGYRMISEGSPEADRLLSNSVIDIIPFGDDVLMGTGGGISLWLGNDWQSYDESDGMGHGSVSALGVQDNTIWAATAYTASTSVGYLPAGGGVGFSPDAGVSWIWFDQPVDPDTVTTYEPTTTNIQNVTYDLLVTSTDIWIASWGGGLRKLNLAGLALGDTIWQVVTPDTFAFSVLDHLNHRAFAVVGDDSILWVGTAAGVNKSLDNGETWENFGHSDGISGNFITALGLQKWSTHEVLWAASWPAESSAEYYGVSMTENGGLSWSVPLTDTVQTLKAHNFAFDDSVVYVASNIGLYKSVYPFDNWEVIADIIMMDDTTGQRFEIYDPEVYSALAHKTLLDTTLWVGTADGIASSPDYGNTWNIQRSFVPTPATYAAPNPFSPRLSPFRVRFVYEMPSAGNVTVKVYDFAMDCVATVADNVYRNPGVQNGVQNYEEWDARRSDGKEVATGVYYYSIERSGASTIWGKVAVVY